MSRAILIFILLLTIQATADEWLRRGDELARWGAYFKADEVYQKSNARPQTVLLRRLAIAENLVQEYAVEELAAELLKMPGLTPEERMRISLAQATVAARAYQFKEARKHNDEAQRLARGLNTKSTILARYAIASLAVIDRWEREGTPTPQEFRRAGTEQGQLLMGLDPYGQHHPLDYIRAGHWNRVWVFYALIRAVEDPANANEWGKIAAEIIVLNCSVAWDRAEKIRDPEAAYVAQHMNLDLAENVYLPVDFVRHHLKIGGGYAGAWGPIAQAKAAEFGKPRMVEEERILARLYRAAARIALSQNDLSTAQSMWKKSSDAFADLGQPIDVADTHYQAAFALEEFGKNKEAEEQAKACMTASRRVDYLFMQAMGGALLGKVQRKLGRLADAESAFWEGQRAYERMVIERAAEEKAQKRLIERFAPFTEQLIQVLLEQGKKEEAMEVTRRARARDLMSKVNLGAVRSRSPEVKKAITQVEESRRKTRMLERALAFEEARGSGRAQKLKTELKTSRAQFFQSLNRIKTAEPEYERLVSIRPTSFGKLQPKLPQDAVLVQYFAGEDKLYIFVATKEELAVLEHPVKKLVLQQQALRLSRALQRQSPKLDGLKALHKHLIKPLSPYLNGRKTLVVAPSEFLYLVPFSALKDERYLIEDFTVVTLTNLEVFNLFGEEAGQIKPRLLAFGDPDGTLPNAQSEVKELATLFDSPSVYLSENATKNRLEQIPAGTSVIHFATHGVLNPSDVNETYLLMAGSGDDSRLTIGEIYGLTLEEVDLVTLSACRTNVGESESVAEIASLAQAFSVAGSQTIVASLWPVDDEGTKLLMVGFYKSLMTGKSMGEALRDAKLSLIQQPKYKHPYHWAAFEILGDWR